MALTIVQRDIDGTEVDAIVIDGTAGTERIIITEYLQPIDIEYLTTASDSAGADMAAKLAATTLPNGQNAYTMYESTIVNTAAYSARVAAAKITNNPASLDSRVTANEVAIADLDARVTVLETP